MNAAQTVENGVSLNEIVRYINNCSRFIIAGHKEPDGDCVGSQLALRSALMRLGKEVIVCSAGPFKRTELRDFPNQFVSPLEIRNFCADDKSPCKVLILDCAGLERTGDIQECFEKLPCAYIDHHTAVYHPPSTSDEPVYVDANSPSCTLIIHKLIKALGLEINEEEAELLLFGLCTDTGFFRHLTEKSAHILEEAAEFVRCGANPKKVFNIMNGGKSLCSRIMTGRILSRIETHYDGKLLLSHETLEEFDEFGFESRDSDVLNQLMLSIDGAKVTVIIRQECAEHCTVSLRSIDEINVAQISSLFGGGGHKNASGLTMKGDIAYVKEIILNSFKNIFK